MDDITDTIKDVKVQGDTAVLNLWYPRSEGKPKYVELGLIDVRSADDIRISYDFDRDGWKIEQAQVFRWEENDEVCDPQWIEVSFVQAWGSKKPSQFDDE